MEIGKLIKFNLILICIQFYGSLGVSAGNQLNLKLRSTPIADEMYSQQFLKSYQQCEDVFEDKKNSLKKYFRKQLSIDIFINVKNSGAIASVNIPINTESDFQYKKWMACITRKTFQFKFPKLPKKISYHMLLDVKVNP